MYSEVDVYLWLPHSRVDVCQWLTHREAGVCQLFTHNNVFINGLHAVWWRCLWLICSKGEVLLWLTCSQLHTCLVLKRIYTVRLNLWYRQNIIIHLENTPLGSPCHQDHRSGLYSQLKMLCGGIFSPVSGLHLSICRSWYCFNIYCLAIP